MELTIKLSEADVKRIARAVVAEMRRDNEAPQVGRPRAYPGDVKAATANRVVSMLQAGECRRRVFHQALSANRREHLDEVLAYLVGEGKISQVGAYGQSGEGAVYALVPGVDPYVHKLEDVGAPHQASQE